MSINNNIVKINVGGKTFQTLKSTLEKSEFIKTMLEKKNNNDEQIILDENDNLFLDCDPIIFEKVLNYLRHGDINLKNEKNLNDYEKILNMCDYLLIPITNPKNEKNLNHYNNVIHIGFDCRNYSKSMTLHDNEKISQVICSKRPNTCFYINFIQIRTNYFPIFFIKKYKDDNIGYYYLDHKYFEFFEINKSNTIRITFEIDGFNDFEHFNDPDIFIIV